MRSVRRSMPIMEEQDHASPCETEEWEQGKREQRRKTEKTKKDRRDPPRPASPRDRPRKKDRSFAV